MPALKCRPIKGETFQQRLQPLGFVDRLTWGCAPQAGDLSRGEWSATRSALIRAVFDLVELRMLANQALVTTLGIVLPIRLLHAGLWHDPIRSMREHAERMTPITRAR